MSQKSDHLSVMKEEFLAFFAEKQIKVFFEGTLGAGGHAEALLSAHPEIELYIGCDQDPEALEIAERRLKPWKEKVEFLHTNFMHLDQVLQKRGIKKIDGFFLT